MRQRLQIVRRLTFRAILTTNFDNTLGGQVATHRTTSTRSGLGAAAGGSSSFGAQAYCYSFEALFREIEAVMG